MQQFYNHQDLAFAFTPFTKHWAVCGADDRCDDEEDGVFENDELHEVRCCSATQKDGWTKRNGCDVWVESKLGGLCYAAKTWREATCICEKYDARLCTKVENESNCGKQTGCAYDKELVWTNVSIEETVNDFFSLLMLNCSFQNMTHRLRTILLR